MKDYLLGVQKVKSIMNKKHEKSGAVFICRTCGLSHAKFNKADRCCKEQKRNKSGQFQQGWRNK